MKNALPATVLSRLVVAFLAALACCQALWAGGDAASFNAKPLDPWKKSCVADMYYIVPTRAGTTELPYLVFTNTCRSSHGCEACLMFGGDVEANFSPFDWSRYYDKVGNEYAKQVNLPTANPQYLTNRPDQFGVTRQMLHVRNGTYYLGLVNGAYTFQNKIDLFDFVRGEWDVFYTRNFTAASEAEAASWRGLSDSLAWMPMVETFGQYANKLTAVLGCDLARFFYDDVSMWQTPDNTSSMLSPVGQSHQLDDAQWLTLSYAPNTHFTVCITTSNNQVTVAPPMGSLCVTTNTKAGGFTLSTTEGIIDPFWVNTPDGLWWDKTAVGLSPGIYRITFTPVAGVSTPPEQIFRIFENGVTTVKAEYGGSAPNTPVAVLTNPVDQQTLWGPSLAATAIVAAGTPPYTVTYYTKPAVGGSYTAVGSATVAPYSVSLSSLAIGSYMIYASVTDSSPVPVTSSSAVATFIVAPTATWSNSAASGNWSNPLSWDTGAVPVSGATVAFGTAGSTAVLDAANRTVSSVLFNRAGNFTLNNSGNYGLTINSYIVSSNQYTNAINAPITLGGPNIWTVNDGSTLQVGGAVGGGYGLTKAGTGTLALTGTNTFSGGVTLNAGTLQLGVGTSNTKAPGSGTLTINAGSIGGPSPGSIATLVNNNPLAINGNFTANDINFGTGAVTISKALAISIINSVTIGGAISGPGGLNALDIAFKNTVGAGYGIALSTPITLRENQTMSGSGEVINGAISDGGHGYGLNIAITDVWGGWGGKATLNAANTYSGDTVVSSGVLTIGHNLALQNSAFTTGAGIANLSVAAPTIGGLKGTTDLASVFTAGYGAVSALTLNPQSGTCTYTGAIANGASGMTLTKNGGGTQVLGGSNSYAGATTVNAGTLVLDGANTGGGAVTVKSGARLGGNGSTTSAVTVEAGGKLLADVSDWDGGVCSKLTVATLGLPATWSINVTAGAFTETDRTFPFLAATGSITGFTVQPVTGPGAGTWLVRQNPTDPKQLELVYTAVHGTATTLELVSSLNPAEDGENVTFTATLKAGGVTATGATGTCAFKVDGTVVATTSLANGAASYSTSSLTPGLHTIVAVYSGDSSYAYGAASLTQVRGSRIVPTYTTRGDGKTVATFTNGSGFWTMPAGVTDVEVLVVGGGGAGAVWSSGGGAGGLYHHTAYAVTPGSYLQVAVGAGGAAGNGSQNGGDGGQSQFDALICYGGIHGGYYDTGVGSDQGGYSVDGGATVVPGNLAIHLPAMDGRWQSGAGAGGPGVAGDSATGGAGVSKSITGTAKYYAGGGGANAHGLGGSGIGGNGATALWGTDATAGAAGTGSGGGGGWGGLSPNGGGSGVVIVAYQPVVPYDLWKARSFSGAFTDTDPGHDPDRDGKTNYQEFAFGLDPSNGSSNNPIVALLGKDSHQFQYTRYAASGLAYTVETSTDLQAWTGPASVTESVVASNNGVETVLVTLSSPPAGSRLFVRIKAQ